LEARFGRAKVANNIGKYFLRSGPSVHGPGGVRTLGSLSQNQERAGRETIFPDIIFSTRGETVELDDLGGIVVGPQEAVADAHGCLRSIYNDPLQPTNVRMKAATIAIEYERPRLAATAVFNAGDEFAARLDRAITASRTAREPKLIEGPREPKGRSPEEVSAARMGSGFAPLRRRI
jgi:hypothetical protein